MLSKEKFENWIFDSLEFIETVAISYFTLLFGIWFRPKKALNHIYRNETVSPFIFFAINVFITSIIESLGNSYEFVKKFLKAVVLTTSPSFDDAFYSIIGLIFGTIIFIFLFRLTSGKTLKQKIQYTHITKPLLYASFLFIPIAILKEVVSSAFIDQLFQFFGGNSNLAIVLLSMSIAYALILWWWSYIVNLGFKFTIGDNLKYGRSIVVALMLFVMITAITSNVENIDKLTTLRYLNKYKETVDNALAKQPPDYFTAAGATMFISDSKSLTPYRRYCEKIRAVVYFSTLIQGFDISYAINKLNNHQYEAVERYFVDVFDKVNTAPHTLDEHKYLKVITNLLNDAAKDKSDKMYVPGEYLSTFGLQFGFSTSKQGIRIVP